MTFDQLTKVSRLVNGQRYTSNDLGSSQEAYQSSIQMGIGEIWAQDNTIPSSSLPFSSSASPNTILTSGSLKYWYRWGLTVANNTATGSTVWYFTSPSGSSTGIGSQLIDPGQQTNFISPKYGIPGISGDNAESTPPGYSVTINSSSNNINFGFVNPNNCPYQFDYKTGVLEFTSASAIPIGNLYATVYQYNGQFLSAALTNITCSTINAISFTGSLLGTSSYAVTASYISGSNSVSSSYATTSSYALTSGGGGTTLITGSTYPITSSWAITSSYSLLSLSASYFSGSISNAVFASTSSYSYFSVSSSYSATSSYTSSLYTTSSLSSSFASSSISSSYALTASYVATSSGVIGGSINYIPIWSGNTILSSSNIYLTGSNIGINTTSPSYSVQISGTLAPVGDAIYSLGSSTNRFNTLYAQSTTVGAFFEVGLRTEGVGINPTGTIVIWKNGKLEPSTEEEDEMVMGVLKEGKDEPIILGAEPILVTGKVEEGDYIVTSNKKGHGKAVKRGMVFKKDLFGKVIAQALETSDKDSNLIKAMIRKF